MNVLNRIKNVFVEQEITTEKAIKHLQKEFNKDKTGGSYYHSWQDNLATQFSMECVKQKVKISRQKLHEVSNQAAKNFLDLLIK